MACRFQLNEEEMQIRSPCPHPPLRITCSRDVFFFGIHKTKVIFLTPKFFFRFKMLFSGYGKMFLTFSEVNGVSSIVKLFLTF